MDRTPGNGSESWGMGMLHPMKKLVILIVIIALGAVAAQRLRSA